MRYNPALDGGDTFGSILDRNRGEGPGFGVLRLGLAVSILLFHARYLSRTGDLAAPASAASQAIPQWFSPSHVVFVFMLPAFFCLSGFLVTGSALRLRSVVPFLTFRVLRLLPALLVEVTLSALILGPLFTNLSLRDYFNDPQFFRYFGNIVGWITFRLPGVFEANYSPVVNGNLWTLPSELDCYLITAALMLTGLAYRRAVITIIMTLVTVALIVLNTLYGFGALLDASNSTTTYLSPHVLTYYFFIGMMFYHWREYILSRWTAFGVATVASYALLSFPHAVYLAPIFVTYVTVFLGVRALPEFKWLRTRDYSYGIYLYGFPITQALLAMSPALRGHGYLLFVRGVTGAMIFAAMSWHMIERRALALKRRLPQRMTARRAMETTRPAAVAAE
jgi:peptidoglycan/LPS O-acetylase OafA/YrhL